jgi:hypothetical protein
MEKANATANPFYLNISQQNPTTKIQRSKSTGLKG